MDWLSRYSLYKNVTETKSIQERFSNSFNELECPHCCLTIHLLYWWSIVAFYSIFVSGFPLFSIDDKMNNLFLAILSLFILAGVVWSLAYFLRSFLSAKQKSHRIGDLGSFLEPGGVYSSVGRVSFVSSINSPAINML